jgi:glycerol-3-phosphate O-acyltransferase/dihydroxyacetone phosphate acyltransferase
MTAAYRIARAGGRLVLGFYFGRIERIGEERIPRTGPVIVAANHPQSVTDALVLGLGLPRPVRFLAHSGLFRSPLRALVLRAAGVIPVYRPQDDAEAAGKNAATFRACTEALVRGDAIGIFPEGASREEPTVHRLKTGTARIALETENAHGFRLGVRIVPVGIAFESSRRFRSRVALRIGEPIPVADFAGRYAADPAAGVTALTEEVRRRLIGQARHLDRGDLAPLAAAIEAVYRDDLRDRPGLEVAGDTPFSREITLSREIALAVDRFHERDPETLRALGARLDDYARRRDRLRLPEAMLRKGAPSWSREGKRSLALLVGLPIAAWGGVWNILPYRLTGRLADRLAPDETKVHWTRLWLGGILYVLYYAPLVILARRILGTEGGIAFAVSLLPAGFFARWYAGVWKRFRGELRYAVLVLVRRGAVLDVRARRRRLIRHMDGLMHAYLAGGPAPSPRSDE